jgi:hypothetical protein
MDFSHVKLVWYNSRLSLFLFYSITIFSVGGEIRSINMLPIIPIIVLIIFNSIFVYDKYKSELKYTKFIFLTSITLLFLLLITTLYIRVSEKTILDYIFTFSTLILYLIFNLSLTIKSFEEKSTRLFNISTLHLIIYILAVYTIYSRITWRNNVSDQLVHCSY